MATTQGRTQIAPDGKRKPLSVVAKEAGDEHAAALKESLKEAEAVATEEAESVKANAEADAKAADEAIKEAKATTREATKH